MKLLPLNDLVIVELIKKSSEKVSEAGIITNNASNFSRGVVVGVGVKCEEVAEGDVVLFYTNSIREIDGSISLKESDCICKIID